MSVAHDLAEQFEGLELACRGGMGSIFRGRARGGGRPVAVKVLRPDDGHGVERFLREAPVLAQLRHPAIVQ